MRPRGFHQCEISGDIGAEGVIELLVADLLQRFVGHLVGGIAHQYIDVAEFPDRGTDHRPAVLRAGQIARSDHPVDLPPTRYRAPHCRCRSAVPRLNSSGTRDRFCVRPCRLHVVDVGRRPVSPGRGGTVRLPGQWRSRRARRIVHGSRGRSPGAGGSPAHSPTSSLLAACSSSGTHVSPIVRNTFRPLPDSRRFSCLPGR